MTYAVKEIFYTLQGEGAHAGRPAVFLRFAGCNLWSGLERDRGRGPGGCSQWCDTDFVGASATGGKFQSTSELLATLSRHWPAAASQATAPFVVCTGGEPLLQLDAPLLAALQSAGWEVAVETNGTVAPPPGRFWLTVSPKALTRLQVRDGDELKLVFPQAGAEPEQFEKLSFRHFFLQPLDGPLRREHTEAALRYCLEHPQWRLSLQTHKILGIP